MTDEDKAEFEKKFVEKIKPAVERPVFPSWLCPSAALLATADVGTTKIGVAIQCPILEEDKGAAHRK